MEESCNNKNEVDPARTRNRKGVEKPVLDGGVKKRYIRGRVRRRQSEEAVVHRTKDEHGGGYGPQRSSDTMRSCGKIIMSRIIDRLNYTMLIRSICPSPWYQKSHSLPKQADPFPPHSKADRHKPFAVPI